MSTTITGNTTLNGAHGRAGTGSLPHAAILFEPDGYVVSGARLMGRQAAGHAFLRAAVNAAKGQPLWGYTPRKQSADAFARMAKAFDAGADPRWLKSDRLDQLSQVGTLFLPGPCLGEAASLRLRAGPAAYSLCGVTHTTATHAAMDCIKEVFTAPVMPWDSLICTSLAVAETARTVLNNSLDYLRWRFQGAVKPSPPLLPIIPLGVHCEDFKFSASEREDARHQLNIPAGNVVALYVGRLSYHGKAHPGAMYSGLQTAAEQTGQAVSLIQCGWFTSDAIRNAFQDATRAACPSVQAIFTDGRDTKARRLSWAAADVFISLSDNIQETFGLTPVEAMAAGLPAVVTDWDGYKETVRDGEDGFRIPTWMPPPDLGEPYARSYEARLYSYDTYSGVTSRTVSVDLRVLIDRLISLLTNKDLRRRLGQSAREHAATFDWHAIYRKYQELWAEQNRIRQKALSDPGQTAMIAAAPKADAGRLDPYQAFGHYPTNLIQSKTRITASSAATRGSYERMSQDPMFSFAASDLPNGELVETLLRILGTKSLSLADLAVGAASDRGRTAIAVAVLAKMGLLHLDS